MSGTSACDFRPSPMSVIWHYANGLVPDHLDNGSGRIGWVSYSHRGIQPLDAIHIGKKQRRDIFCPRFEVRFNTDFAQVMRYCGDPNLRNGRTWLTPSLIDTYVKLHQLGYAHSFECWENGKLAGGGFGMQIGGYVSVDSIFHLSDNAGKCAYVRALLHLKERGFEFVDVNGVTTHLQRWGAYWVPRWKFEQMLRHSVGRRGLCWDPQRPAPPLPLSIRLGLPLSRLVHSASRRLTGGLGIRGAMRRTRAAQVLAQAAVTSAATPQISSADAVTQSGSPLLLQ